MPLAVFADGEVTYRRSKDGTSLDSKQLTHEDHPDLVARYRMTKPGSRRFVITAKADQPQEKRHVEGTSNNSARHRDGI